MTAALPPLPGGVGITHLRVYDSEAPDGLRGGTPHLHTACTEAYWVVSGEGRVETLSAAGFDETPLTPGALVWFTPGTIHRLVNLSGDLEILVIMGNAGLPEAGDLVIAFAPEVVADPDRYHAAAALPAEASTTAGPSEAAQRRRDAAVERFNELRVAVEAGDRAPLDEFLAAAVTLVAAQAPTWRQRWEAGPVAAVDATAAHLMAVEHAEAVHLREASIHRLSPPPAERRMGCCGTLGTYVG
jgi:mannose-6-phosphate isomerase-like protein (cupin superfamily)